jgi:hypothetical protein
MDTELQQFAAWWSALPREWAFMFLLPFAVAAAALLRHAWRRD